MLLHNIAYIKLIGSICMCGHHLLKLASEWPQVETS